MVHRVENDRLGNAFLLKALRLPAGKPLPIQSKSLASNLSLLWVLTLGKIGMSGAMPLFAGHRQRAIEPR
jgi:hypothetical protein